MFQCLIPSESASFPWKLPHSLGGRDLLTYPFIKLRVILGPDTLVGPGKADLLQGIDETGSIAAAGRRMGMSYKRAWYLIDTMNAYFSEPVAVSTKGGPKGGGASLTPTGREVLQLFRRMQNKAERAVIHELRKLAALRSSGSKRK
jgi:molybdate transport system regulatory protein